MYPECQKMIAYGEFREPMKGMKDNRLVVCFFIDIRDTVCRYRFFFLIFLFSRFEYAFLSLPN